MTQNIQQLIQEALQQQREEFEIQLSKQNEKILELENTIKAIEIQHDKQIKELQDQIATVEKYSHDKMPKLDNDLEYLELINEKSDHTGSLYNPDNTPWKLIYYHFYVDTPIYQKMIPNKTNVLVSTRRWNEEKKPEKRYRPGEFYMMVTNNHYFELKLEDDVEINKEISFGVVTDNQYNKNYSIGALEHSVGLSSEGLLRVSSGVSEKICGMWRKGDVIGCGIVYNYGVIYFTLNGVLLCQVQSNCTSWFIAINNNNFNGFSLNFGTEKDKHFVFNDMKYLQSFPKENK